jgi:tetratricopeptide (TPR) repeat protein
MREANTETIGLPLMRWDRALPCLLLLFCGLCIPHSAGAQTGDYARAEALVRNHQWNEGLTVLWPLLKADPRNVKALNLAGLALTGKGDTQQADEYFKKSIAISPGFVPALKNLSINEFNQQQYSAAERHLLTAQKEVPDDPVVNLYLGEVSYRQSKFQLAADAFSRAFDLASQNPNALAHLAVSYFQTGQQKKALELADRLHPEQIEPRTQFALGIALEKIGKTEQALPYLVAVRQYYPNSYDIGFDLMLVSIAAKDYAQAIQVGKDLIRLGHETSELNNILAEAYADDNKIQPAVDAYRRAIALDPDDEDNYLDFISLCLNQRSLQAALTVVEVGLKSHPRSDRLVFMRGVVHATQDEFELAEKDFKLSADLSPQNSLGVIGLGVSYLETGHDAQAIQVLRQRLRAKPDDASLLYLLGEGLIRSGASPGSTAYSEAQSVLEKSTRLNPNLCLPHISLGTIYLDEERARDAAVQFELARAIDPKERSAYSHLAVAYRRLGEAEKSKEVLTALKDVIEQERRSTREKMKTSSPENAEDGSTNQTP